MHGTLTVYGERLLACSPFRTQHFSLLMGDSSEEHLTCFFCACFMPAGDFFFAFLAPPVPPFCSPVFCSLPKLPPPKAPPSRPPSRPRESVAADAHRRYHRPRDLPHELGPERLHEQEPGGPAEGDVWRSVSILLGGVLKAVFLFFFFFSWCGVHCA